MNNYKYYVLAFAFIVFLNPLNIYSTKIAYEVWAASIDLTTVDTFTGIIHISSFADITTDGDTIATVYLAEGISHIDSASLY